VVRIHALSLQILANLTYACIFFLRPHQGGARLVQAGQKIHESVLEMIDDDEYVPTAEIYNQIGWDIEELEDKGIVEKDLFASARNVILDLQALEKTGRCEISDGHLNVLETLCSTSKFVR
jgi:hypothetical protein